MGGYVIILFYCITCIVSALYMLNTGMYGGEAYSVGRVHFSFIEIIVHLLIVVLGYFCIYRFYNRTKDKKTKYKIKYNVKRLDKLYFIKYLHLSRNVIFQSTSDEETDGIKKYFSNNRIVFLNNVPTLTKIRKDYSIKKTGEAKFVFVSRIVWKKNLLFALQVINRVNDGSLQFDIYGSIEEPQYWEECLKIINNFSNKIKINYCGVCKHDDIPIILSSYDALFFPTFSENYGHIIAESLSVGLPIIISDQTPWSNINSTKGGWAIPLKDEDMYLKAVESIIGCSSTEMKYRVEDSIAFFRKFTNIDLLRDDYLKSFSSLK